MWNLTKRAFTIKDKWHAKIYVIAASMVIIILGLASWIMLNN